MKINSLFPVLLALMFFIIPGNSSAFQTTAQKAVRLNDTTVLYSIDFEFTFLNRDVRVPIGAVRNLPHGNSQQYIGYSFKAGEKTSDMFGKSYAIVLSDEKVADGMYAVPRGKKAKFTLLTLLKVSPNERAEYKQNELALKITSFPLILIDEEQASVYQHSVAALEQYLTPMVRFR